jgi:hypothetical protein
MTSNSNRGSSLAGLVIASALSLLLVACGGNGALDAQAAEPGKATSQPSAADPALDSLEGVTHHG